jgi:hypothetical protein
MATWIVRHVVTGQTVDEHGTKKAATAQAKQMTEAHEAINAKHEGQSVSFVAVKVDEAPPQETVAEEAPAEEEA